MLRFVGAGMSHVGLVRGNNEDSGFLNPRLALVADGVGGAAAGEIASATATFVVAQEAMTPQAGRPWSTLDTAVRRAQTEVSAVCAVRPDTAGMASTLSAFLTDGRQVCLAHLGDSRAYVCSGGVLRQVSRDHTWVQDMVDQGQLSPEEAARHPWRSVVLTTVNAEVPHRPDIVPVTVSPGDRLLVCSDGLSDLVERGWIEQILGEYDDQGAVEALVAAALTRGGKDNVTVVLATVEDGPATSLDGKLLGAVAEPGNVYVGGSPLSDTALGIA